GARIRPRCPCVPPGLQELSGRIALSETKPKHRRDTAPATETLSRRTGGVNVTAEHAKIQHLFQSAAQRGVPSIGIADGRNEVGCGLIYDDTRIASVSNYGAYGVSAMLGFLLGDPDLVHDPDTHYRMLEANVREGASDGIYGRPIMKEDGISSLNGHYPAA